VFTAAPYDRFVGQASRLPVKAASGRRRYSFIELNFRQKRRGRPSHRQARRLPYVRAA